MLTLLSTEPAATTLAKGSLRGYFCHDGNDDSRSARDRRVYCLPGDPTDGDAVAMAKVLHATMEEVESGLFRADYPGEMNGEDVPRGGQLPDRHIATSRDDVRVWVEEMAVRLGYERVEWH